MNTAAFRLTPSKKWEAVFVAGLVVLFVGISVSYSIKVMHNRSAFRRWQPQLEQLDEGVDISQKFNYPNPPIMGVLLLPLAKLPPLAGALAWFYLKAGMALLSIYWIFKLVETPDKPFPAWAKALAVLLSLRPILGDLQHGNVNLFILFLLAATLEAFRRRLDLLSGVLLALAISCKVTPALFVPYLMWKRAWKSLAGVALGLALFLWPGVVPSLKLGFAENQHQLVSWYEEMVKPFVFDGKVTSEHPNQSLPGLVYRLATKSPSFVTYVNDIWTPAQYHNLVALEPATARWILKACLLVFAGVVVWTCRTPLSVRQGWRLGAETGLIILGMLLLSERTWKHHCVTLTVPFAAICCYLSTGHPGRLRYGVLAGILAASTILMTTTSTSYDQHLAKLAQVYGAYTFAVGLLAVGLVAVLRAPAAAAAAVQGDDRTDGPTMPGQTSLLAKAS